MQGPGFNLSQHKIKIKLLKVKVIQGSPRTLVHVISRVVTPKEKPNLIYTKSSKHFGAREHVNVSVSGCHYSLDPLP